MLANPLYLSYTTDRATDITRPNDSFYLPTYITHPPTYLTYQPTVLLNAFYKLGVAYRSY